MNTKFLLAGLVGLVLAPVILIGCGADTEPYDVTETRQVENPRMFPPGIPDTPKRLGFRPRQDASHAGHGAAEAPAFSWTLPAGWTELPARQFRQGNWSVGGDKELQAYLTAGTGGGVLGNVNRWRGQMGLAPAAEADMKSLPTVPVLGQSALLVELDGDFAGMGGGGGSGYRMLGVIAKDPRGGLLFVKLVGPKAKVDKARAAFLTLCRSLKAGNAGHGGTPAAHSGNTTRSGLKFVAPEGWRRGPERQMREITFHAGEGTETECYVTVLSAAAADVVMNVNMWRGQMSLDELPAEEIQALPAVEVLGQPAQWVEIKGSYKGKAAMGKGVELKPGYRMLALICGMPKATVTVKMVGPDKVVAAQKQSFLAFCQSLHL